MRDMHQAITDTIAYIGGAAATVCTFLADSSPTGSGWLPLIVQAGMAGIVVLLVLRHIPELIRAQSAMNDKYLSAIQKEREAFRETLKEERRSFADAMNAILSTNAEKDRVWQEIISTRGHCPVRDGVSPPDKG